MEEEIKKLKTEVSNLKSTLRSQENIAFHEKMVLQKKVEEAQERARKFHRRAQKAEGEFMKVYGDVERENWAKELKKEKWMYSYLEETSRLHWQERYKALEEVRSLRKEIKELKESNMAKMEAVS